MSIVCEIVPETLSEVKISKVAYLHLDMNNVYPEIEAVEHYWGKLSSGAVVLLDDYGWGAYSAQHLAIDDFASGHGVSIANIPTGQGLLIKS